MRYIVIDQFGDYINLICNSENGFTKIFDKKSDAEAEARNCQCGIVVEIN